MSRCLSGLDGIKCWYFGGSANTSMLKSFWILEAWENCLVIVECELQSMWVCVFVWACTLNKQTTAVWLQDEAGQLGIIELLFLCPDLTQNFLASARLACDMSKEEWTVFYLIETRLFWQSLQLGWATHGFEFAFDLTMKDEMLSEAVYPLHLWPIRG